MRLYFIIALIVLAAGALIAYQSVQTADAARAEPLSPRMQALLCWHEFQSGRRATTADCPEL